MLVWLGTRLIALPDIIYCIFTKYKYSDDLNEFAPFIYLNGIFLSVMCCLHFFWFAMFCKILSRYIFTGEAEDEQNKVEKDKKTN